MAEPTTSPAETPDRFIQLQVTMAVILVTSRTTDDDELGGPDR